MLVAGPIERLERLNYRYSHGEDLQRPREEVVLKETLRNELARRYPALPSSSLDQAVARFSSPQGVDSTRRNMQFHTELTRGIDVKVHLQPMRILPAADEAAGGVGQLEHRQMKLED